RAAALVTLFPLGEARHGHEVVALLELDQPHPLRVAADGGDLRRVQADDHTFFGNEHHLLVALEELHAHHRPVAAGGLDVDYALAPPALQPVLLDVRALAVAVGGQREHGAARAHHLHAHHLVALFELDALHAVGGAAHGPHVLLQEVDGHALASAQ